MQEISVYLNSRASHSNSNFWTKEIGRRLFRSEITFRDPENYEKLIECLDKDIDKNINTVISVGGDGTVHTLIQKLAGKEIALLVIPAGTANDLANELGTSKRIGKVISWIRQNKTRKIDLISINGKYIATNGGIGFAGQVAKKINTIRRNVAPFKKVMKLAGKSIYSFFAASEILDPLLPYYNVRLKSKEFEGDVKCAALLVNNQRMLGGSFQVAPETLNNDGSFNVTILTHKNRVSLTRCLWSLGMGLDHSKDKYIISFETKELKLELLDDLNIPFFGDGEILETSKEWHVKIIPSSLLVYSSIDGDDLINVVNEVSLS